MSTDLPFRHFVSLDARVTTGASSGNFDRSDSDASSLMSGLFRTESPRLLLLARRMLGSAEAADDVVQDAFLAAWRSLGQFRGDSSYATWLYGITVRTALTALRRRSGERILDRVEGADAPDTSSDSTQIDATDLERAISLLSAGQRAAFVLRDVEGFSTAEAARQMGVAEGTVKAQLFLARRRLATSLRAYRTTAGTKDD